MYVDVIIPLKFRDSVTYSVPPEMESRIVRGSIVKVTVVGRTYSAVVLAVKETPDFDPGKIKPVKELVNLPPVTQANMDFLRQVASYYMCSLGEAFRFAAPSTVKTLKRSKTAATSEDNGKDESGTQDDPENKADAQLPVLSDEQNEAAGKIREYFRSGENVLLHGVTGSGKTEIYITLAAEYLKKGLNVLYLVPEIALSRQIQSRLALYFGDKLLVYHSKQTAAHKRQVYEQVASDTSASYIVLGLRSALFLPYHRLGLIIVDEEHDTSYKQTDQAPRYHGRDTALMLGRIHKCPVMLGSATPSLESIYNVNTGKLRPVILSHRYYGGSDCFVTVVDMPRERRKRAVRGSFSLTLTKAIEERLERKEQVLVFRSRRAYASALECPECGYMPRCPHCNIPMSYHKFNDRLSCHYCGYSEPAPQICPQCGKEPLALLGDGTERVEEELREMFPQAIVERFDADVTKSGKEEARILRQFSNGEIDILVGTQMISKGFDFKNLTLTAVLKAEAVTQVFDFRADEKALQLLRQLMGRAGRRATPGEMIVQTNNAGHPVFRMLLQPGKADDNPMLDERREYRYPPFSRILRLSVKSPDRDTAVRTAYEVRRKALDAGFKDICGPTAPPMERSAGEFVQQLLLKTDRSRNWEPAKARLYRMLRNIPASVLTIDVDPVNV
ncbi:MAG TPA: primosomal protein N' [Candidatus Coprenecus stercoravium]|uniref:Replication restart protein PriA n=1 Tax=Candidatus Coprenecus stercoravium TaxID=2840735 RepID=A0A9D2K9A0_9BACT|nr:primosomal protein N' [Candidatus Coprenecus stercoravium]